MRSRNPGLNKMEEREEEKAREIERLKEEIQCLQENLTTSAEAGSLLLKSNQELEEKYENDVMFYQQQIEELKQENYTLSNKLSIQSSTHQAFQDELEHVKSQTESLYKRQISVLEQDHTLKIQQMNWQLEETRLELDRLQMNEQTLQEKIITQERLISKLGQETPLENNSDLLHTQLSDLQNQCKTMECNIQELQSLLLDKTQLISQQNDQLESQEIKLKELEETLDDRVKLSNELYRELQETQEHNKLLNCELERNKLERLEDDWQNCGNSLFGEVEERRLETERKYISLQVKYDTLERTHQMLKQHFKKLKAEMSALLCRHGTFTADAAQLNRLQRSLHQRDSDIRRLTDQVYKLNKEIEEEKKSKLVVSCETGGDNKGYIQYLQQQIVEKEELLSSVGKELDLKTTQLVWEASKLTEAESRLHKSEQDRARLLNDATKTRLKLNEVKEKENDLKVQLKMAEQEIATLKQQLKVNLRKGQVSGSPPISNPATLNKPDSSKTNTETITVKRERKAINLLEELEKENAVPLEDTVPASHKPRPSLSATDTATELEQEQQDLKCTSAESEDKPSAPPPNSVNVIKIDQNVNRCPQQ